MIKKLIIIILMCGLATNGFCGSVIWEASVENPCARIDKLSNTGDYTIAYFNGEGLDDLTAQNELAKIIALYAPAHHLYGDGRSINYTLRIKFYVKE